MEGSTHIRLPYDKCPEVPSEIRYVRSFIEFLSNPTQYILPDNYQDMFVLVTFADFVGCDVFVDFVSSALRVQKKNILNVNSISSVCRLIRNKYRQNKYNIIKYIN